MRALVTGITALLSALVLAAPDAPAKPGHGPPDTEAPERRALVCGSSSCTRVGGADALPLGGPIGRDAPAPAPYYTLAFERETAGGELESYTILYVPGADAVAASDVRPGELTWFPVFGPGREAARQAVHGVDPFPSPASWPAEPKSPGRVSGARVQPGRGSRDGRATPASVVVALVGAAALGVGIRARPRGVVSAG